MQLLVVSTLGRPKHHARLTQMLLPDSEVIELRY